MSLRPLSLTALLALGCSVPVASASPTATDAARYVGTWNVTLREAGAPEREARLTLADRQGTWLESGPASRPCNGRRFPVTVLRSNPAQLDIVVRRNEVARACTPLAIRVAPVDAKTLVGGLVDPDDAHGHDHSHAHGPDIHATSRPVVELRMTRAAGAPARR